jgi:hypothetical protein
MRGSADVMDGKTCAEQQREEKDYICFILGIFRQNNAFLCVPGSRSATVREAFSLGV